MQFKIILFYFALMLFFGQNSIVAQEKQTKNEINDTFLFLNLPHTSHTLQKSGFSLTYNMPGFISLIVSEIGLVYKNKNYDSYSLSIGGRYFLFGINKYIIHSGNSSVYANVSIGALGGGYFLGSGGISYLFEFNHTTLIEFGLDAFFHHGLGGGDLTPPLFSRYNTKGIVGNIIYSKNIFNDVVFSLSSGLSYTEVMRVERELYFYYTSKQLSREYSYIGNPKWDFFWLYTFGITISYHF